MGGRRQSIRPSRPSVANSRLSMGFTKASDPRPIGTKAYTQQNIRALITYLTSHNCDIAVSPKMLGAPTRNDFKAIITFLFRQIDPNFEFGSNFEDEVKNYMRRFGYPMSISKAALTAVGSPHTWPSLLAALVWLTEELAYAEEIARLRSEYQNGLGGLVDGDEGEQVFFQYTAQAYRDFLSGYVPILLVGSCELRTPKRLSF